ncbi:MAG: Monosaccharide-transporting ATPase [Firmicutes bacterium]|nr:Monosaccharide-transporting ATPase [Bacillota bacterium]
MKKKHLKLMALALTGAMLLAGLTGCGSKSTSETDSKKKVGLVLSTLNNPFFVSMKEGAQKAADEAGYTLIVADSGNDAAKERSNVEDLIQQGVSVLIINPTDSDAVGNAIKVANDSKIPVITVDRKANSGTVACYIASDNVTAGKMAAEFLAQKLGNKGNIVEIQGTPGASATNDRGKGFADFIATLPDMKIVASQSANFDRQKGLDVMQNIMQSTPEFDAVFAHNDEMALGAINALAGKNVLVVGIDGGADAQKAVQEGTMAATIAQQPDLMGSLAVQNAVKIINNETVPASIPVDLKLITK